MIIVHSKVYENHSLNLNYLQLKQSSFILLVIGLNKWFHVAAISVFYWFFPENKDTNSALKFWFKGFVAKLLIPFSRFHDFPAASKTWILCSLFQTQPLTEAHISQFDPWDVCLLRSCASFMEKVSLVTINQFHSMQKKVC